MIGGLNHVYGCVMEKEPVPGRGYAVCTAQIQTALCLDMEDIRQDVYLRGKGPPWTESILMDKSQFHRHGPIKTTELIGEAGS